MIISLKETLLEGIEAAKSAGFSEEFIYADKKIKGRKNSRFYFADQCKLIEYCRYEGMSDPTDVSMLFLIECYDGTRGTLSSGYGTEAQEELIEFVLNLKK